MKKVKEYLFQSRIQRIVYVLFFLIWGLVFIRNGFEPLNKISSLGIKYLWIGLIPAAVFLFQAIFNNRFGWGLLILLVFLYDFLLLKGLFDGYIMEKEKFEFSDLVGILLFFIALAIGHWVIFVLKPTKIRVS